ncbi:MAG TPA: hypothetical protein DCL63_00635 [Firmicutes bacterium]|jgi:hypothetical protein|nr:hypothetical protein [Bacillota bacterium]
MRLGRYAALSAISLVFCVALAGCGAGGNQKKLLSYFPPEEGFVWEYAGTDDYAQTMGIDSIYKASSGEVTYSISGETRAPAKADELGLEIEGFAEEPTVGDDLGLHFDDQDESDEAEEPEEAAAITQILEMEYEFTKESVVEKVIDADGLPYRFSELEVLRAPIKKGKTWSFQAPDWTDVKAEIVDMGKDADKADYVKVKYEAEVDGGPYVETRLFKKGLGLVEFTAVGPDYVEFVYSLIGN